MPYLQRLPKPLPYRFAMPSPTTDPIRSKNMRAIKARGNRSTELRLKQLLRAWKIMGWRSHPDYIVGRPDFVFQKKRLVVFVDGCFWHGCPRCGDGHLPKSNIQYWSKKIHGNKRRDGKVGRMLRAKGYSVLRIWEHQLRRPKPIRYRLSKALSLTGK